jgi:hypothetical protein
VAFAGEGQEQFQFIDHERGVAGCGPGQL